MRYRLILLLFLIACAFRAWPQAPAAQELRAHQRVLDQARTDFSYRAAQLTDAERADYRTYIRTLEARFAAACVSYRQQGISIPEEVDCSGALPAAVPVLEAAPAASRTRGEVTDSLDEQLDAGLGEFDELLLREQARVKADAPHGASGDGSGVGGQRGEADGETQQSTETASSPGSDPVDETRDAGGVAGEQQTVVAEVPADIPDGSDDDVVARQLRAAAEQETDPQLREKLWDEYRKYKQGTSSQ